MARDMPLKVAFDRHRSLPVLDTEFATLWCYREVGIVHHRIKRLASEQGDELRALLQAGLDQLVQNDCRGWLSDNREGGRMRPEIEAWAKTVWQPQAIRAGWRTWAIVLPELTVSQLNMQRFAQDYSANGIETSLFSDPDRAMEWLLER